jgi:REP element-mobilizing transposase RayT
MPYNPNIHHRRSIRLKGYDYSQAGLYFVTICCQDNIHRFGKIENGEMLLNDFGTITYDEWVKLSERYPNLLLDVFQIMPNHIHGIIALDEMAVGATLAVAPNKNTIAPNQNAVALNDVGAVAPNQNTIAPNQNATAPNDVGAGASPAPTIGNIVGAYKSLVANKCLEIYKLRNEYMGKLWQRNYWEHIIRDEKSYQNIANYILNNPANWQKDRFYHQ